MDNKLIKIFKLLTDKHSRNLVDRHSQSVKRLVACSNGICLKDLLLFTDILCECQKLISFDSRYEDIICSLCAILRMPLLKQKTSDEKRYANETTECLNTLGEIAELSTDLVKVSIANCITYMYTVTTDLNTSGDDINVVSSKFIKTAITSSTVCKSIVQCLGKVSNIDLRYDIILSLSKLSDSSLNCDGMLKADIGILLCKIFIQVNLSYRLLFVAVELLWNIFENGNKQEVIRQVCNDVCLSALDQVFVHQVNYCTSSAEKQLRNDILVVISLIVSASSAQTILYSKILKTISIYASYPEIESHLDFVQNIKLGPFLEDFEFKKQLLIALVFFCKDIFCAKVLCDYHIVSALLTYLKPITLPINYIWSVSEFEELQLQAIAVLATLIPYTIVEYNKCQGNTRLLLLLDWCFSPAHYSAQGNCFYSLGGRGGKRAQMRFCIRLLRNVCSTENDVALQDLYDQGAINQVAEILQHCCLSTDQKDELDVEMQSDMLFILSILTQTDQHKKELFGESGVRMLLLYLKYYMDQTNDVLNFRLALSTLDCIRASILGCAMNEMVFLQNEGVFLLLDVLQKCPSLMQNVVLSILLDLSENEKTIDHLKLWLGKKEVTFGKLLINFWVAEEQRLGVLRDDYGVIADIKRPLLTKYQHATLTSFNTSPSIFDVTDNLRAKIYGLLSRIDFKVSNLKAQEAIALEVIKRYLDFKTLEVWQEIESELENVKLVASDKKSINVIVNKLENKAQHVANNQRMILQKCLEEELDEEYRYFEKLKESRKQEDQNCRDFLNFVGRTSDFNCLQRARMKQLKCIESSRLSSENPSTQSAIKHSTLERRLQTTTFCGRNVIVQSTNLDSTRKSSLRVKQSPTKLPELIMN